MWIDRVIATSWRDSRHRLGTIVSDAKPAVDAGPHAGRDADCRSDPTTDAVVKSPPATDKADVEAAEPGPAATPETPTLQQGEQTLGW